MKKLYFLPLLTLLVFTGCSKDFLKKYDKRILGTWRITDVNRIGIGGDTDALPFTSGSFTFREDGTLTYVNEANVLYEGKWDIVKKYVNDQQIRTFRVTAVDFASQEVLAEFYDEMSFVSTNHFKATITSTFHNYMTHFKR